MERKTPYNSTYPKVAVQWLNKVLCFVSSSVVVDSFRLRNRQHLVAAKRYPHAIFPTRVACLPPSNWADKNACKISVASSSLMKRAGNDKMFASLC